MIKFRNCLRKLVNFNVNARNIGVRCYSKNISNDDDVEIDDVDQKSHVGEGKRKPVISSGVKLYPGFQKSVEDKNEFDGLYGRICFSHNCFKYDAFLNF